MKKEQIRQFGYELGVDAVGFAAIDEYQSEQAPDPRTLLPDVKSLVVLGYREPDGAVESRNPRISFASRMGVMELSIKNNYLLTRYIEDEFQVKAASIPASYPLDMDPEVMGLVGDISLRHAAVAAGLGVFGRHNLVIHPRFGTRIVFTAILSELTLNSDPPVQEELCTQCDLCVEACPAQALDEEGKTDMLKCLKVSQPYGIGGTIRYLRQFVGASPEEQKEILKDPRLMSLYQAHFLGFQYFCNECMAVCPV
ncbi:MAG: epoxyqueuosine reductase [Anaerolineales bacterium]|nr:epoxyqueuosine reductase [Anaerolineales bacterium]